MIHVSVRYYNIVAHFLGRREERRAVEVGTTTRGLIEALAAENASLRRLALTADGKVAGHVRLFRNGRLVLDADEQLAEGDEIQVFPAIAGGATIHLDPPELHSDGTSCGM